MNPKTARRIACFISPHGYGHAARASAVMEAAHEALPGTHFDIYTLVPRRFFEESLRGPFTYRRFLTDIGLAQKSPLEPDLFETVRRLDRLFPLDTDRLLGLADSIRKRGCGLILCDIAPMGIEVARAAGLPSVLLENFTWDWIYESYDVDGLRRQARYLTGVFEKADHRIQAEPICRLQPGAYRVPPISRRPRSPARTVRAALGVPKGTPLVLVTQGGVHGDFEFLDRLALKKGVCFLVPGASKKKVTRKGSLVLMPHHSGHYHPDLVRAADAVVGKAGYSTLAEVYREGVPFGYVLPVGFRESTVLADFIRDRMPGMPISEERFHTAAWLDDLPDLLALPRGDPPVLDGALEASRILLEILQRNHS